MAGCTDTPAAMDPAAPICSAQTILREIEVDVLAGAHYVNTPTGGATWDGRSVTLTWRGNASRLVELLVIATWDATLADEMRLGILREGARSFSDHWSHGPVNGPSPLALYLEEPKGLDGAKFTLDVGMAQNATGPASVALDDRRVHLAISETYGC